MHYSPSILSVSTLLVTGAVIQLCSGYVAQNRINYPQCTKTTVAILGGGMAGVTAAQALTNASITDFILVEYRDTLGGRVWNTEFGQDENGDPYSVEFGANWVQGVGAETENPIWRLAQKYNLRNTYSNYGSIRTYNETGYTDYSDLLATYARARSIAAEHAGRILNENLQDMTARSGLALAGWRPRRDDMAAQAVEWWSWGMKTNTPGQAKRKNDWETSYTPEASSFVFGVAGENLTFHQFGDANNLVIDPRGYRTIIQGEADTFLTHRRATDPFSSSPQDPRLRLNTQVTEIEHHPDGVTIHNDDGSCITAAYAICTFSLGVLQNHAVRFTPPLPEWKQTAIEKFNMGTYTKIFLQFNETFWDEVNNNNDSNNEESENNQTPEFFLYASPTNRGYYPVFQSLSGPTFLPGSNIIFVTVVDTQAYRVERQSDEETKAEVLAVLRQMFPNRHVPEPIAFAYPRWSTEPWAYGSYSNWPAGTTLEMHQNLRANVGRVWFAGEATSSQYFGFLHGAWFEGKDVGESIAGLLRSDYGSSSSSSTSDVHDTVQGYEDGERRHYAVLHGTTPIDAYSVVNGWGVNSTNLLD